MNTINPEEIITCKSYIPLCDYVYDAPNLDDIPPTGLVHVPLDQIEEFFSRIDSNGHRYVVVSSCSDYGLAIQQDQPAWQDMLKWLQMQIGPHLSYNDVQMPARVDKSKCNPTDTFSVKCHSWTRATFTSIPHNVHHWFVANLMFVPDPEIYNFLYEANTHEKITAIPFGIAEGKQEELHAAMQLKNNVEDRENKIYISWNDYTYERYKLRADMVEWQSYAGIDSLTVRYPGEPDSYDDYLKRLSSHKYCISPPGNGADCYRTLESIYMGCIVFVEDTPTNHLTKLPVFKYSNSDSIIGCYNRGDILLWTQQGPETKLSHWKGLIYSKRNEMF